MRRCARKRKRRRALLRYLALSTAIVLLVAVIVAAYVNRDLIRIRIGSVSVRVTPKAADQNGPATRSTAGQFFPNAPWALSALPECLSQISSTHGPVAYVRAHLPHAAVRIDPPARMRYADCTVDVRAGKTMVSRGGDRFAIYGAQFFKSPGELSLLIEDAGHAQLRTYIPSKANETP